MTRHPTLWVSGLLLPCYSDNGCVSPSLVFEFRNASTSTTLLRKASSTAGVRARCCYFCCIPGTSSCCCLLPSCLLPTLIVIASTGYLLFIDADSSCYHFGAISSVESLDSDCYGGPIVVHSMQNPDGTKKQFFPYVNTHVWFSLL